MWLNLKLFEGDMQKRELVSGWMLLKKNTALLRRLSVGERACVPAVSHAFILPRANQQHPYSAQLFFDQSPFLLHSGHLFNFLAGSYWGNRLQTAGICGKRLPPPYYLLFISTSDYFLHIAAIIRTTLLHCGATGVACIVLHRHPAARFC